MSTHRLPLFRPDVEQLQREDMPFAQVMERRKSVRKHGRQPIADKQLGEFLYRFARVTELYEMALTEKGHTEKWSMTKRPYPSGGGRYSLELYVTVDRCENIPSAFYHYYPLEHALYKVSERTELVERLLALGRPNPYEWQENPQVLITIAARFQRLFWKYKGFAYAVLLKESGILTQSMYLVATAMGLAPCEVGIGDAELFARIAGTDYYAETCIGEFTLGSMPDDDQTGQSDAPV
jgi:SagB-type dehydrogenase family enzyme